VEEEREQLEDRMDRHVTLREVISLMRLIGSPQSRPVNVRDLKDQEVTIILQVLDA
jgi:hypothetical protein